MENSNSEKIIVDDKNDNLKSSELNADKKNTNSTKKSSFGFFTLKKIISIIIIIIAALVTFNLFFNKGASSSTVVTSILQDQKVISELSTLIVPCGSIYEELDDKGKEKLSIAYRGTVEYGLNFSKINISANEEEKIIAIKIPPIEIKEIYIEPSSISLIPEGKYNETTTYLQKCKDDLLNKFTNNSDEMYELAKTTAIETISSFLEPIVKNMNDGYTLIVEQEAYSL